MSKAKVYSVEVLLCGTAYVIAETAVEAAALAQERFANPEDASVPSRTTFGAVPVAGYVFDGDLLNPDLPTVSLSPALTFWGAASLVDKLNPADITADGLEEVYDPEDHGEAAEIAFYDTVTAPAIRALAEKLHGEAPRTYETTVEVMAHRVSLAWWGITGEVTDEDLAEDGESRARAMIAEDYHSGELNYEGEDASAHGWWRIVAD